LDGIVELGDANGDGKADLVIYRQDQGVARVALSTGNSFAPLKIWASGLPKATQTVLPYSLADVNGDRMADLIVFVHGDGQTPGSANTYVALSTGAGFQYTAQPVWNAGFCITEQVCKVADINADGKADLLAFTPNFGLVWASLSTGTAFGANSVWHNFFCIQREICAAGDVDGDRRADLILFKPVAPGIEKGNVLVAASTGTAFSAPRYGHGFFCIDAERCFVADFNNDGRADILLVKGLTANPEQPGEVLVSLSNGDKFINAVPFLWGHVRRPPGNTGWGVFLVGDVTGDGRSDLVQTATISVPSSGGGFRTIKTAYVVYPVMEGGAVQAPSAPPGDESASAGYEKAAIYNCDPDQHRFTYWVADLSNGSTQQHGPIDAMYSEAGYCPDPTDDPFELDLEPGHSYQIVAVDPASIGCEGRNDPTIVACAKHQFLLIGAANGRTARIVLQAGPILRTLSLQLTPSKALLSRLGDAGLDYSVSQSEILDWLGNSYSKYIQFGEGLLLLLEGQRLKRPVYIDVAFWSYEQSGGKVHLEAPEGGLDAQLARRALVSAYNSRYGANETTLQALIAP
jgi:hypothetical protein